MENKKLLLIGGLGFFGTNFQEYIDKNYKSYDIFIIDKLSYASLTPVCEGGVFHAIDASDKDKLDDSLNRIRPDVIINFAAQSHVDNSIKDPKQCLKDNYEVVFNILEWIKYKKCQFIQISTDEVYGDREHECAATEWSLLAPSSPYSATKAAADLLIQSYVRTFKLKEVKIFRFTNLFGKYQHEEKMIPKFIKCLCEGKKYPLYGSGDQIREWTYVKYACAILMNHVENPVNNDLITNVCSNVARTNRQMLAELLEQYLQIRFNGNPPPHFTVDHCIETVEDRKGHDNLYMMCGNVIFDELQFRTHLPFVVSNYFNKFKHVK